MDELGLDTSTTLDEFYDVLTQFHDAYGAVYYMSEYSSDPVNAFAQCYGISAYASDSSTYVYYIAKDGEKAVFCPVEDNFLDYLTTMNQWYNEGLIYADFLNATDSMPSTDLMLDGTVGIIYYSISNYTDLTSQTEPGDSFQLAAIDVPVNVETGEPAHLGREIDYASLKGYSLSTNLSPNSDEFLCDHIFYHYSTLYSTDRLPYRFSLLNFSILTEQTKFFQIRQKK